MLHAASQTHEGDVAVPLSEDRGDIAVPLSEDLNSRPGAGDAVGDTGVARKRAATANRSWRWANGVIPYNVSQEYTGMYQYAQALIVPEMNVHCINANIYFSS